MIKTGNEIKPQNTDEPHFSVAVSMRKNQKQNPAFAQSIWLQLIFCFLLAWVTGCSTTPQSASVSPRRFDFARDTFSYANGLVWEYRYDSEGKWITRKREPRPDYSQHCFVVSRSACQFFENALFDPGLPKADTETYRRLIRKVVSTSLRTPLEQTSRIVFPGYPDLRSFSQAHAALLKAQCGGAWQCYFQRGNWRVIFPFSRSHQDHVAQLLEQTLQQKAVAVVHLVRFPQLSINHAVVMFEAKEGPDKIEFLTYDPNEPEKPVTIAFDRSTRTFNLPANAYFQGGRVDVYPIYDRWLY
jgi:hypothetical protein